MRNAQRQVNRLRWPGGIVAVMMGLGVAPPMTLAQSIPQPLAVVSQDGLAQQPLAKPQTRAALLQSHTGKAARLYLPQTKQDQTQPSEQATFLDVEGTLIPGDRTLSDGSLYDVYPFEAEAGQAITIELVSDAFDTYLIVVDPNGQTIGENDDASATETHSALTLTLPEAGTYLIVANAFDATGQGDYRLTVARARGDETQAAAAGRLFQQGIRHYYRNQFSAAIQAWQQALDLYRSLGNRQGEARSLGNLGNVAYAQGRYLQAIDWHQQSLAIAQEIGDRPSESASLGNLGLAYDSLGQYQRAIELQQQALAIDRELGDREGEATSLNNLGLAYRSLGQYQLALEVHQQSLAIKREMGNRSGEVDSLGNLGLIYLSLGQYQQAIEWQQQALDLVREIGDRRDEASILSNLGLAYHALGQYQQAIDLQQQAREIAQETGNRQGETIVLSNLGLSYNALAQYPRAIDFHQQHLTIAREMGDRKGEATALANLGIVYTSLGQYQRAIDFYQQSLGINQAIGHRQGEAVGLGNLGLIYDSLGQYQRAIDFYQQALAIAQAIGDRQGEADSLNNLGVAYYTLGQYQRAIDTYQQSLTIKQEIGDRRGEAASFNNLGIVYYSLGDYSRAIELHQQAFEIQQEIGDRQGKATSFSNLGNAYHALGQYDRAIDLHQQSLAIDQDTGDRESEAISLNNLGLVYIDTARFAEAEITLTQAVEAFESLRTDLSDQQRIAIADTQTVAYNLLEQALVAQGKLAEALVVTERSRAQAFALQLALRQADEISATGVSAPTVAEIQRIAQEQNATLVTYSLQDDRGIYIWVVQPSGEIQFRSVAFDGSDTVAIAASPISTLDSPLYRGNPDPSDLDTLIANSRRGIGVVNTAGGDTNSEPEIAQLQTLHQLLIDPIADLLPTDPEANVIFIPQGNLFLVPFAALQDRDGTYLIEKHTILTAPSIQVLDLAVRAGAGALRTAALQPTQALVVGNPVMPQVAVLGESGLETVHLATLPGAEAEALAIGDFLGITPLIGAQATEAQIKQQLPQAQLIHFATHGLLEYGDPQSSGVLDIPGAVAFTPGDGEDGLLTATEILEMDLQAQLAILSACDTGRGRITGDGVVGLSRSLITAGVPSVIVSLWAVPDSSTAALMTEFYQQLQQGQTKAQALRQAMLITLQQYPEPRSWAAFTLMGSAD